MIKHVLDSYGCLVDVACLLKRVKNMQQALAAAFANSFANCKEDWLVFKFVVCG